MARLLKGADVEEDEIRKALLKRALGYDIDEIVSEYSLDKDGQEALSKKKVRKKHYSPDISAAKLLLERFYRTYEDRVLAMSDEELEREEKRLEELLKKGEKDGNT